MPGLGHYGSLCTPSWPSVAYYFKLFYDIMLSYLHISPYRFDLRSLRGPDYEVTVTDEQTLYLSVCKSLQNSSCGPNVASCLVESNATKYWSAGKSKPFLHNISGGSLPLLYYDGGSVCNNNSTWSTIIMFECGTEDNEGPKFHSIIDCKYVIHWYTHLVCERKVSFSRVRT